MKIIGRDKESDQIKKALKLGRNLLVEGPVGVGKTFLIQNLLKETKKDFVRVDGDTRYTEQKLTGWFDPPIVLKKGYVKEAFVEGPLVTAMKKGQVLFINELNRMPEAVQNILLPAMDERTIVLPKLGEIKAKAGFSVVATQNPKEFTATHALSEALLDRFEMIHLDYQTEKDELEILKQEIGGNGKTEALSRALQLVRATREHAAVKRGASVRAAIAVGRLLEGGLEFEEACLMALPSRIEVSSSGTDARDLIQNLIQNPTQFEKKKN
ncbi:MAG: MoxR family ATPase [Bdellovibrionota bacterium]